MKLASTEVMGSEFRFVIPAGIVYCEVPFLVLGLKHVGDVSELVTPVRFKYDSEPSLSEDVR